MLRDKKGGVLVEERPAWLQGTGKKYLGTTNLNLHFFYLAEGIVSEIS